MLDLSASKNVEADEQEKPDNRDATNYNERGNNPRLRLVGNNAVEDVSEPSELHLTGGVSENTCGGGNHHAEEDGEAQNQFAA